MPHGLIALIVPTLNGGEMWKRAAEAVSNQNAPIAKKIVIDSGSCDNTIKIAKQYGFEVLQIEPDAFNHGRTRQQGVQWANCDLVVMLTQDSVLTDSEAVARAVEAFDDSTVGAVYGRQLPHKEATPIAAHARFFNYPAKSGVKSLADIPVKGIKTAFISNSFAVYRCTALRDVGGFPPNVILGEDMCVAAKMILAGWKITYCSTAQVYHSHNYSMQQEFQRYFDIGAFHARQAWLIEKFGKAEGEGKHFIVSEWKYLWKNECVGLLPEAIVRTAVKYIGYCFGKMEAWLPMAMKKRISMHKRYWKKEEV